MRIVDRRAKAQLLRGRETRRSTDPVEVRETPDGLLRVSGLASATEVAYPVGFFEETIAAGAFSKTLAERPDCQLLINHEGLPLARTTISPGTAGSLSLREDSQGLTFEALLDATDPDAQQLARKVRSKLLDQCSFSFRVVRDVWNDAYDERRILELSMARADVSVVNFGANAATAVSVRKRGGRPNVDLELARAIAFAHKLRARGHSRQMGN